MDGAGDTERPYPALTRASRPSSPRSDAPDTAYYGSLYDWMYDDEGELLGLLLALPTQPAARADSTGGAPALDVQPLPVYAVFAGSGRGSVVPSSAGAKPHLPPTSDTKRGFDPRWVLGG